MERGLPQVHALLFALIAGPALLAYPEAWPLALVAPLGLLVSAWLPIAWRQRALGEAVVSVLLVVALLSVPTLPLPLMIRLGLCTWILVPARPRWALWLVPVLVLEALMARTLRGEQVMLLALCLPLALSSAAAWPSSPKLQHGLVLGRGGPPPRAWALPLLVTASILCFLSLWLWPSPPLGSGKGPAFAGWNPSRPGLELHLEPGDQRWIQREPTPLARLTWESGSPEGGLVYLRALTLPEVSWDGERLSWSSLPLNIPAGPAPLRLHAGDPGHKVRVLRLRQKADDAVLRPDGAAWVNLGGCLRDADGNIIQPGLDLNTAQYVSGSDAGPWPEPGPRQAAYRRLPDHLQAELRTLVPNIEAWAALPSVQAAARVRTFLQERCVYDLAGPNNILEFLGGQPAHRQGHCQHFTSAAVILLRAAGHAARPVLGLASDEHQEQSVIFRAWHAHAWAEFLDEHDHWQRLDATPAAALTRMLPSKHQSTPAEQAALDQAEQTLQQEHERRSWLRQALGIMLLAALALACVYYARRRPSRVHHTYLRANEHLLDLAVHAGISVLPGTSLRTICLELEARSGISLRATLEAYQRYRFGGGPPPPPWPLDALKRALRRVSG